MLLKKSMLVSIEIHIDLALMHLNNCITLHSFLVIDKNGQTVFAEIQGYVKIHYMILIFTY